MNEAMLMLEEGAGIKELDNALKDFGFPVGPVALLDEVGIDVAAHVSRNMGKQLAEARKIKMSRLAERMVEAGFEGRKNRKGFYLYPKKKRKGGKPVNQEAYKVIGASKTSFGKLDMAHRLTLPMVNEAVRCLEEGVLACARDGDVGAVFGLGFPPFRAGPFHFVDHTGVDELVAAMERLAKKHGPRFEACELLNRMAQNGERFYP
jgi:3-hydroxyacyl-CoA dehydrogenase/enoyl-CoA hydratase/3-hydroxybutyryl-CoA epimerase